MVGPGALAIIQTALPAGNLAATRSGHSRHLAASGGSGKCYETYDLSLFPEFLWRNVRLGSKPGAILAEPIAGGDAH